MRIEVALTSDLGLGSKKRVLDANDSHVDIPSAIMPTAEIISPIAAAAPTLTPSQTSFSVDDIFQKTNTTAFTDKIVTLDAGLWEISMNLILNFVAVATAFGINQVVLWSLTDNPNNNITIPLVRAPISAFGPLLYWPGPWRVLLRQPYDFQRSGPATAVGDNLFGFSTVFCRKLI